MRKITSVFTVALLLAFLPTAQADQHNAPDEMPMAEQTQKMQDRMQMMQQMMQQMMEHQAVQSEEQP